MTFPPACPPASHPAGPFHDHGQESVIFTKNWPRSWKAPSGRVSRPLSADYAQPITQGEVYGEFSSQTCAGFWKMPIDGSAAPSKLNRVRLTFGEPTPEPGSHGTPG